MPLHNNVFITVLVFTEISSQSLFTPKIPLLCGFSGFYFVIGYKMATFRLFFCSQHA